MLDQTPVISFRLPPICRLLGFLKHGILLSVGPCPASFLCLQTSLAPHILGLQSCTAMLQLIIEAQGFLLREASPNLQPIAGVIPHHTCPCCSPHRSVTACLLTASVHCLTGSIPRRKPQRAALLPDFFSAQLLYLESGRQHRPRARSVGWVIGSWAPLWRGKLPPAREVMWLCSPSATLQSRHFRGDF